jgi:hypothetical protein
MRIGAYTMKELEDCIIIRKNVRHKIHQILQEMEKIPPPTNNRLGAVPSCVQGRASITKERCNLVITNPDSLI